MNSETLEEEARAQRKNGSTIYVTAIAVVATLGGFLFGYDTAVISGAIGPLTKYFGLSEWEKGWATSCALLGCMAGAGAAGFLSHKLGRKLSLIIAALLYTASAVGSALPDAFTEFVIFRIVGGLGVGLASMVGPMYIAEIAPPKIRGRLVSYNQLAIVLGIFIVYFVNYFIDGIGDEKWDVNYGWRYMLASETIVSVTFFALLLLVPESPRYLVIKEKAEKAKGVLQKISGKVAANKILNEIQLSLSSDKEITGKLFTPLMMKILLVGIGLSVFQQVSGINAFLYYAPEIFGSLGSSNNAAMLQTTLVGTVNMVFTLVAIVTVDKLGRKPLMIIGSVGMIICLAVIGWGAYTDNIGAWLVWFVLGYIAFFALSLGPVVWVLLAEMFPNRVRSAAMSIAIAAQWISNFLVTLIFPVLITYLNGALPFWTFAVMCVLGILFVSNLVVETKGKTLEEMEATWEERFDG